MAFAQVTPPSLASVPDDALKLEICAVVELGSRSRERQKNNTLAWLRPAATALRKAGLIEIARKIADDISTVLGMMPISGAYGRLWTGRGAMLFYFRSSPARQPVTTGGMSDWIGTTKARAEGFYRESA